jgi:hypothetical protein
MNTAHPKFVRWALLIGIVIALNLFFLAARSLVLPEPSYDDYCPTTLQPAATEEACVAQDGVWVPTPSDSSVTAVVKPNQEGYCDLYQKCQPLYDDARDEYEMYTFVIMVGLGVLSLIVGVIPMGSSIVSSGLSYGGVLALVIAAGGYWGEAENLVKLGMSLVALIALIYVGIRRFKD